MRGNWGSQMVACTATATADQEVDIIECLRMSEVVSVRMPCAKPNLRLTVAAKGGSRIAAESNLVRALRRSSSKAAVVFCSVRKECEKVSSLLEGNGISAAAYHAGLADRGSIHERFRSGASCAFCRLHRFSASILYGCLLSVRCVERM
jgi:ATP-dependent DNA helicase RecQ